MTRMIGDMANLRVTVMGLGRFGGGAGVTRWLATHSARVLVTDLQPPEKLRGSIADLQDLIDSRQVTLRLGAHFVSDFTDSDLVIANPAVPKPWENKYLLAAKKAGVPITTEIRLLLERLNRQRVIGVTGSAGKSTTAAMIHHILNKAGTSAHFGGNIGGSLLNQFAQCTDRHWTVLELSSAMLYWLGEESRLWLDGAVPWSPHIAVLTNITPNHLDWHGTFEHYQQSKLNIFRFQSRGDRALRGEDLTPPPPHSPRAVPLQIPGKHNQLNATLAIAAAQQATGIDFDEAAAAMRDFAGLPHRLQLVGQADGMRFYNDSKSTTPEATLLAVAAFENPARIHLIAGGYDKGSDLKPIANAASALGGLYTIGKTGQHLAHDAPRGATAEYCETLERAVERALSRMSPQDILLLSPGCASWDQFDNFEQRGEEFVRLVNAAVAAPARPPV